MKRFLSLILALTMISALLPVAFASDEAQGNGNEWVFNLASHGLTEETRMYNPATAESEAWSIESEATVAGISDSWGFSNQASLSDNFLKEDFIYINYDATASTPAIDISDANRARAKALSLELVADTSGEFFPNITYVTDPSGAKYELYLINKKDKTLYEWEKNYAIKAARIQFASLDSKYRIGTINTYGEGELRTEAFPKKEIEAGTYYFVIVANGVDDNWKGDTTIKSGKQYGSLKLVSFVMKDSASALAPFYKYNISKTVLSDTYAADYSEYSTAANGHLRYISWEETISGKTPAIDTTKTDGFAFTGRNYKLDTSPTLYDAGFASHLKVGVYTAATDTTEAITTLYFNEGYNKRPFCLLKLNVPIGGEYKVIALNAFTADTAKTVSSSRATISNNYVEQGSVATVHMVKATTACKYDQSGTNNYVNNTGSLGFSENSKIGSYDCRTLAASADAPVKTEIGTVELSSGEYYIFFDVDSAAGVANSQYWNYKNGLNQIFLLSGIELTPVSPTAAEFEAIQSAYDSIANVDPGNATEKAPANTTSNVKILCGADNSVLDTDDIAAGSSVTYTAPEKDGYTFLYWAQGIGEYKKIVSYDAKLSLKAEKGPMWLTAVYADDSAEKTEVVFYNANGDEISRSQYNENDVITLKALPSMAGFETATGWTLDTDGETYTSADEVKASGRLMRFVAEYAEEPSETFEITVVDGTADNVAPVYGETVTVTAPLRKNNTGTQLFNYWEKDGEIVSFDSSYSFKVWKDTIVTAVYKDYLPAADSVRKIIVETRSVGEDIAAVAEFIGITDAVEKGILFGTSIDGATHKVAMKTDGDTFSVIDDVDGEATGYVILTNGNVIYSK